MPRPTLKLPAKPATPDETKSPTRKPIRGGFKAPKQTAAQHAASSRAKPASPADAGERPRAAPRPRPAEQVRAGTPVRDREIPRPRPARPAGDAPAAAPRPPRFADTRFASERPPQRSAPRPPRGIARSTGARAFPPAPVRPAADRPAAPRPPSSFPTPLPPLAAPPAPATEASVHKGAPTELPRLAKRMSELGLCSRREADEWIENGWVSVDGVVVTTLGARVHPKAVIKIRDEASQHLTESVTIILNKPIDYVSGPAEDGHAAALDLIRADNRWAEDTTGFSFKTTHLRGLALAGRLDTEASGMLVFTQEGGVARRLTGDDSRAEKEYLVRVEGELTPEGMALLKHGLSLDEVKLKPAQVSWQSEAQLRFVVRGNRKQQVPRMCELVGLRVTAIKRLRIGSVSLGKLPAGQWRYLRSDERF
jgi:23S rRNA pseudouridine2604 synthase